MGLDVVKRLLKWARHCCYCIICRCLSCQYQPTSNNRCCPCNDKDCLCQHAVRYKLLPAVPVLSIMAVMIIGIVSIKIYYIIDESQCKCFCRLCLTFTSLHFVIDYSIWIIVTIFVLFYLTEWEMACKDDLTNKECPPRLLSADDYIVKWTYKYYRNYHNIGKSTKWIRDALQPWFLIQYIAFLMYVYVDIVDLFVDIIDYDDKQKMAHCDNHTLNHTLNHSLNHSSNHSSNHSLNHSSNHSSNHSLNHSSNHSSNHSLNHSSNHSSNHSLNHSSNHSDNQDCQQLHNIATVEYFFYLVYDIVGFVYSYIIAQWMVSAHRKYFTAMMRKVHMIDEDAPPRTSSSSSSCQSPQQPSSMYGSTHDSATRPLAATQDTESTTGNDEQTPLCDTVNSQQEGGQQHHNQDDQQNNSVACNYFSKVIQKIDLCKEYDFCPSIFDVSLPLNSPGYTVSVLLGLFTLVGHASEYGRMNPFKSILSIMQDIVEWHSK